MHRYRAGSRVHRDTAAKIRCISCSGMERHITETSCPHNQHHRHRAHKSTDDSFRLNGKERQPKEHQPVMPAQLLSPSEPFSLCIRAVKANSACDNSSLDEMQTSLNTNTVNGGHDVTDTTIAHKPASRLSWRRFGGLPK